MLRDLYGAVCGGASSYLQMPHVSGMVFQRCFKDGGLFDFFQVSTFNVCHMCVIFFRLVGVW